jgi:hypothetical protein
MRHVAGRSGLWSTRSTHHPVLPGLAERPPIPLHVLSIGLAVVQRWRMPAIIAAPFQKGDLGSVEGGHLQGVGAVQQEPGRRDACQTPVASKTAEAPNRDMFMLVRVAAERVRHPPPPVPGGGVKKPPLTAPKLGMAVGCFLFGHVALSAPPKLTEYANLAGLLASIGLVSILKVCLSIYSTTGRGFRDNRAMAARWRTSSSLSGEAG